MNTLRQKIKSVDLSLKMTHFPHLRHNKNSKTFQSIFFKEFKIKSSHVHHNMTGLFVFFEKQRYRKLNFFQCLDTIAMKILSPKI